MRRGFTLAVTIALVTVALAQQNVGIGTTTPHASALLHLESTSQGLLIPRLTQAQRDAISSPATGLLIYQTDNNPGFYYYSGTSWIPLLSSSSGSGLFWSLGGNAITDPNTQWLGTSTAQPLIIRTNNAERVRISPTGNVGIGTSSPFYTLDVQTSTDYGGLRVQGTQNVQLVLQAPQGSIAQYIFYQGTVARFINAVAADGSYWAVGRFDNSGTFVDLPIVVSRTSGNVGIGTAAPTALLHVADAGSDLLRVQNETTVSLEGITIRYANRVYPQSLSGSAAESAALYARIDPQGSNNHLVGIYGEVTTAQDDGEGAFMKIVHFGRGDAVYVPLFISGGAAFEAASFNDGTTGFRATLQNPAILKPNTVHFNALWGQATVPAYGMYYADQAPGNAFTIRKLTGALDGQTQIRLLENNLSRERFAVYNDGAVLLSSDVAAGGVASSPRLRLRGSYSGTDYEWSVYNEMTAVTPASRLRIEVTDGGVSLGDVLTLNAPGIAAPAWSIHRNGGNPRGLYAIDWQASRSSNTQVASGDGSVIAGGANNTASGVYSVVSGGEGNTTSGDYSIVVGGSGNTANGAYNLVFGQNVVPSVTEDYRVYLFGDGSTSPARPSGRVAINRLSALHPLHVGTNDTNGNGAHLTAGGVWMDACSRDFKELLREVGFDILDKIAQVQVWEFRYRNSQERHIAPVSEDFHEVFGTNRPAVESAEPAAEGAEVADDSTKYLAAIDVASVALAGVQALYDLVNKLSDRMEKIEAALAKRKS